MSITLDGTNGVTTPDVESSGPISGTNGTFTGNVGIGVSPPSGKLHVVGGRSYFAAASEQFTVALKYNATTTGVWLGSPGTDSFTVSTEAGTERMRIDASGNVGIGTTSPGSKLDVNGDVFVRGVGVEGGQINLCNPDRTITGLYIDVASANSARIYQVENNSVLSLGQLAGTGGVIYFSTAAVTRLTIDAAGGLILAGSTAQKATGTTWSNPSDQRLKSNIMDYPKGITELMQVRVREWEYNGKGGTTAGMAGLGVIADEVMTVLPNTVDTYDAKLNEADEETTAIKKFDATEITWLLVKAVQEQQAMIQALQADIAALKGV